MLKVFATGVVVSKGYNNAPALKYSTNGESVRFRFGKKVYDPNTEDKSRWLNMSVKAFGGVCEHIKKMQLKEGAYVNIIGRLDEDTWTDETTGEKKTAMVVIADEIEYAYGNGKKDANSTSTQAQYPGTGYTQQPNYAAQPMPPQGNSNAAPAANPMPNAQPSYPAGTQPQQPVQAQGNPQQSVQQQGNPQQSMQGGFTGFEQIGNQSLYDMQ